MGDTQTIYVEFMYPTDDVPMLEAAVDGPTVTISEYRAGTKEYQECSGRVTVITQQVCAVATRASRRPTAKDMTVPSITVATSSLSCPRSKPRILELLSH